MWQSGQSNSGPVLSEILGQVSQNGLTAWGDLKNTRARFFKPFPGGIVIQVQFDPYRFTRWLNMQVQNQVPYASARALTSLAKMGQEKIRSEIQSKMIVRRPWALRGIQVVAARKSDGLAAMQSEVGSKDWFMADQLGDAQSTRTAKGGKKQFLPKGARGSKSQIIPSRLRPAKVTAAAKAGTSNGKFFFQAGRGGRDVLYQKQGRGKNAGLKIIYTVGKDQTVKPKFSLHRMVETVAATRGEKEFVKQLQAAIKSAR